MAGKEQEQTILGGWILGFHLEDIERFSVSDFSNYPGLAKEMLGGELDPFTLADRCRINPRSLVRLTEVYADSFYQIAVKEILRRRVQRKIADFTADGDLTDLLEEVEEYQNYGSPALPRHAENFAQLVIDDLDVKAKQETASTGLKALDKYLYGIKRKEFTVVAARPSVGKSAFGVQLIRKLAEQEKKVLYFPLEMSTEANLERMVMHDAEISAEKMARGGLDGDDWKKISPVLEELNRLSEKLYIYESVSDINTIAALVDKEQPYAIVIDQLEQLRCKGERFKDKRERFSFMTNTLQNIAMTRNVAVLLMCQVSRSAQNSEPTMANLKESGSIEEDADNVIILHRFKPDEMSDPESWNDNFRPVMIKVEKHRSGEVGNMLTAFMSNRCKFVEVER